MKETRTDIPGLFRLIERNEIKTVFLPVSFLKAIFKEEEYIRHYTSGVSAILRRQGSRWLSIIISGNI